MTASMLAPWTMTYEIVGPPNAPVVLVLGGISSSRHVTRRHEGDAPGWWEGVAGLGAPLDVARRRILGVDFVDGGRAADGRPARVVTTVEQARSIVELLDILNIEALDVVGASYGGMVALALAQEWPERVRRLVVISAAHESHPMATGLRALQRRVVELGLRTGSVTEAMAIARGIAMTTYRTSGEFAERFDLTPRDVDGALEFDVEQYLMHAGEKFAAHTAPERFLALSLSSDLHHVTPERIAAPTTVIASHGDTLVPAAQTTELARRLPHLAAHHTLHTRYGHDAFLLEVSSLGQLLIDALSD